MAIQLKIGDVVHVRGTVIETLGREVGLDVGNIVGGVPHYFWIPSGRVVHVERAPLKVGDHVAWRGDAAKGTIIAIDLTHPDGEARAWIRRSGEGISIIVFLNELECADEPRPLKIGDKVRYGFGWVGTIVELPDVTPDSAKVRVGSEIKHLNKSDLERVE